MDLRRRARSTRSATQKPAAGWRFGHSISFSPGSVSSPSPTSAPIFRTLFGARAPRTSVTSCWKNTTSRRAPSRPSASSHPGLPAPFAIYLHAGHTARVEIDQRPFAPVCCLCPAQGRRSTIFPTRPSTMYVRWRNQFRSSARNGRAGMSHRHLIGLNPVLQQYSSSERASWANPVQD